MCVNYILLIFLTEFFRSVAFKTWTVNGARKYPRFFSSQTDLSCLSSEEAELKMSQRCQTPLIVEQTGHFFDQSPPPLTEKFNIDKIETEIQSIVNSGNGNSTDNHDQIDCSILKQSQELENLNGGSMNDYSNSVEYKQVEKSIDIMEKVENSTKEHGDDLKKLGIEIQKLTFQENLPEIILDTPNIVIDKNSNPETKSPKKSGFYVRNGYHKPGKI